MKVSKWTLNYRYVHNHCCTRTTKGFSNAICNQTGEALVLAPSGLGVFPDHSELEKSSDRNANRERANPKGLLKLSQFGRGFLLMKTRSQVTKDGGASVLVVG